MVKIRSYLPSTGIQTAPLGPEFPVEVNFQEGKKISSPCLLWCIWLVATMQSNQGVVDCRSAHAIACCPGCVAGFGAVAELQVILSNGPARHGMARARAKHGPFGHEPVWHACRRAVPKQAIVPGWGPKHGLWAVLQVVPAR